MLWLPSPCVSWHRRMSRHIIYFRSCTFGHSVPCFLAYLNSAELEMTVNMLIQIDKLVQLLESPVFTCECHCIEYCIIASNFGRSSSSALGAGEVSTSIQVSLRALDALTSICSLRSSQEPPQQRQRNRLSPYCPQNVRFISLIFQWSDSRRLRYRDPLLHSPQK